VQSKPLLESKPVANCPSRQLRAHATPAVPVAPVTPIIFTSLRVDGTITVGIAGTVTSADAGTTGVSKANTLHNKTVSCFMDFHTPFDMNF
jgi:hypothetical protein